MEPVFANNEQLEKYFGFPIKEKVEIDSNKIYGYASCSNLIPEWRCQIGGFLKVKTYYTTEISYLELIAEKFTNEEGYHNTVFFEVERDNKGFYNPVAIIQSAILDDEFSRLDQESFIGGHDTGYIMQPKGITLMDLTNLYLVDDMKSFEWEI